MSLKYSVPRARDVYHSLLLLILFRPFEGKKCYFDSRIFFFSITFLYSELEQCISVIFKMNEFSFFFLVTSVSEYSTGKRVLIVCFRSTELWYASRWTLRTRGHFSIFLETARKSSESSIDKLCTEKAKKKKLTVYDVTCYMCYVSEEKKKRSKQFLFDF